MNARCVILAALMLPLTACHKSEVTYYHGPKEKDPAPPGRAVGVAPAADAPGASSGLAGTPGTTAGGPNPTWTAPPEWESKPAAAMRKASYTVPGDGGTSADLSITAFPGDVGGEIANINRWRGQLRLPPLGEADVASAITRVERDGLKFALVDLVGPGTAGPQRTVGAMVPFAGATWFFKLTGPDAPVAKAKPAFEAFLTTVKPSASTATP